MQLSDVDWEAIRKCLADVRKEAGYDNPSEFSDAKGFDRSTAYRIEKGEQKPGLDTIDEWLRLTTGENLGQFFSRLNAQPVEKSGSTGENLTFDKDLTSSVMDTFDTVRDHQPRPINVNAEGVSHGTFGARSRLEIKIPQGITESEARLLEHIGLILIRASNAVLAPSTDGQAVGEEPRRRKTDR